MAAECGPGRKPRGQATVNEREPSKMATDVYVAPAGALWWLPFS